MREKDYQDQLVLLSAYSPSIRLRQEVSVLNTLNTKTRTRRFDLIQELPNLVRVYEIKAPILELDAVKQTLVDKEYLKLAQVAYSKPVELVFVAPLITDSARDYISKQASVYYLSTIELSSLMLLDYKSDLPPCASFMLDRLKTEFSSLLSASEHALSANYPVVV